MLCLTIVTPPLIKAPQKNVEIWGGVGVRGGEDDVEKVGRTSGKNLATPLLKLEKTTGVLRNVLIICPGSHFQGSADQESFVTKSKKVTTVVSGRSLKCHAIFLSCLYQAMQTRKTFSIA